MQPDYVPSNVTSITGALDERIPSITWDEFYKSFAWRQGEHIGMIGPTGSGKTTLALSLLSKRKYITIFGTKPKDSTLDELKKHNFKRVKTWDSLPADRYPRRILWPDATSLYAAVNQRNQFRKGFEQIYLQGGWCLYIDELWFMCKVLGLEFEVKTYLLQARSLGISLVAASQRPRFIPLEVYDQSTHLFFWRDNDESNLSRISGIAWLSANLVRSAVAKLEPHQVLYINTRADSVRMVRFTPPAAWNVDMGRG